MAHISQPAVTYMYIIYAAWGHNALSVTRLIQCGLFNKTFRFILKSHCFLFFCAFYQAADLVIQLTSTPNPKPDVSTFGSTFTDHMLTIEWSATEGWQAPLIKPFGNLSLHPACSSLHYGIQVEDSGSLKWI